ncbi:hypothetical protein BpHYR1_003009 [Brachionus plicatilis]|uniref:Uncharacterized protein n=1 Tax=Brachionus plicatilis TaxID=10195 RepID=A0A3M7Q8X5_BRAPC|nr:hypothetical protein BpHYR1_003009 [Brachionus plicatilis]
MSCFADLQSYCRDLIWVVQSLYQLIHFAEQFIHSNKKLILKTSNNEILTPGKLLDQSKKEAKQKKKMMNSRDRT